MLDFPKIAACSTIRRFECSACPIALHSRHVLHSVDTKVKRHLPSKQSKDLLTHVLLDTLPTGHPKDMQSGGKHLLTSCASSAVIMRC